MHITIETVTPAKAEAWLNNNTNNRSLREGQVEKYAADMKAGRWTECPEPISFYENGDLADGQHRLFAICESGATIEFPVARGLSREAGLTINTGLGRNIVDNARISGADDGLSKSLISADNAIHHGVYSRGGQSNSQVLEIVQTHREAAEFAARHVRRQKLLCGAVVMGAVGRAWYVEADKDRLIRYCDVLGSGLHADDSELAATVMRNYLLTKPAASSGALWRDTFLKLQNSISYFMRGKKITVVKAVSEEAYPLPKAKARSKSAPKRAA